MTAGVCFAYVYCYRFGFLQMEFQICLHFCVSFLGRKKKQLRDLGGQIYKVKLIITIEEARISLHWPLLPHSHRDLILFIVVLAAPPPSSKATGSCRCYDKVTYLVSQADVHSAPFHQHFVIQREQTLWEQIGTTQRMGHKKKKKILQRT